MDLQLQPSHSQGSALSSSSPLAETIILLPLSSSTEDQQLCIRFQKGMRILVQNESDHETPPSAGFLKANSVVNAPTSLSFPDRITSVNVDSSPADTTKDTAEPLQSLDLSTLGSNSNDLHPRYRVKKGCIPVAHRDASDLPPSLLPLHEGFEQQIDIKVPSSTNHEAKPNGLIRDEEVITSPTILWPYQSGRTSDSFPSFWSHVVQDFKELEARPSVFPNDHDTSSSVRLAEHPVPDLEQGSPSFTSEAATITHSDSIDDADQQIRDKARKMATEIGFGIDDVADQMSPGGLSVDRPVTDFMDLDLDFFSAYNRIVSQLDALAERYGFQSVLVMAGDDPHKDVSVAESYETSRAKKFFKEKLRCPGNRWIETHLRLHVQNNILEEGLELHRRHLMADSHFTRSEPTGFHLGLELRHPEELAWQPGYQQGNATSLINALLNRHGIKVQRANMFPWRTLPKNLALAGKLLVGWPIQVHLPMTNTFDGEAFSKLPEDLKEMLRVALLEETLTIEDARVLPGQDLVTVIRTTRAASEPENFIELLYSLKGSTAQCRVYGEGEMSV